MQPTTDEPRTPEAPRPAEVKRAKKKRAAREAVRLLPLVGLAGVLLVPDLAGFKVVLYMLGILLLVSATSHVIRKILFPYLDMEKLVDRALEDPRACGMVFLGVSFILGVMIFSATGLLK